MLTPETLEEIEAYILKRLPQVLARDPQFATLIEGMLAEKFPRRDEFARMLEELQEHRRETQQQFRLIDQRFEQVDQRFAQVDQRFAQVDKRFEQVDKRFEQVDQRFAQVDKRFDRLEGELQDHRRETSEHFDSLETEMRTGFDQVHKAIDRLGARWGIRNERVFRQTMRELLEKSFGAQIQERVIRGEQFDCVIIHGEHILVELSASVGPNILERLRRKRQLYIDETGITPARFLLVVGAIHSRRAEALRAAGFEVIEPEETEE
ncbi:MAG: DUF3782 domain-containing protein [Caldilineaceae bacterium]